MAAFYWPVLSRIVCASRMDSVAFLFEEILYFGVVEEFATLIKVYVFIIAVWIVLCKEVSKPL